MATSKRLSAKNQPHLVIAVVALLCAVILIASARWGSLWHLDSTAYIDAARNFAHGLGLVLFEDGGFHAWVHHPPLLPLLLAATNLTTGIDPMYFGWYLDAALLSVNAFLVGHLLFKALSKLNWAICGVILVGFAQWNLETHATVFSEPLSLFFMLTSLYFLWRYLQSDSRKFLIASALLANFGVLTRYSGGAFIVAGVLCILLLNRGASLKVRLYHCLIYLVFSTPLIAAWLLHTVLINAGLGERTFGIYLRSSAYYVSILDTFASWLFVDGFPRALRYAILLVVGFGFGASILTFLRSRKTASDSNASPYWLFQISVLYAGSYLAFLGVSHLFFDPDLWLSSQRILLPFYYLTVIMVLTATAFVLGHWKYRAWAIGLVALCASLLFAVQGLRWLTNTGVWVTETGNTDQYPYRQQWFASPTIARLQTLPSDLPIYSFEPVLIYMLVGRYGIGLDAAKPTVTSLAVVFDQPFTFTFERTTPIPAPIDTYFPASDYRLTLLYTEADGQIYQIDPLPTG